MYGSVVNKHVIEFMRFYFRCIVVDSDISSTYYRMCTMSWLCD
jgi:hypothetical protein